MYTDEQDEEEDDVVQEDIGDTKSSKNAVDINSSLQKDTFERRRKLSRQFSDDFIDMFKVGDSDNVEKSPDVLEKSNEDEKEDSSEPSSTSENIYIVNPDVAADEELVRPARPSLTHAVPSLGKDLQDEAEEEEDLFLSAEDLLVQALCLDGSKKIIGEEDEDRISKYRVCERISEASEESSLELVPPEKEAKDLVVFSDIFSSVTSESNENMINLMIGEESRKESTSSILPDIRDIQSQIGDTRQEKEDKRVKEIDMLDEDTMTSVEINQLFDDELKQVGEIKQGLSELSHTLVVDHHQKNSGEKLIEGRSLRHVLCSLGNTRSSSLEEVFPAKELLRRSTSEPLLELIEESEEEKVGFKDEETISEYETNNMRTERLKRNEAGDGHIIDNIETNVMQFKKDTQRQISKSPELKISDNDDDEALRPILKKRTRLSVSESGSQTEITAIDDREERRQVWKSSFIFASLSLNESSSTNK